jgi:hypothetical protein
MACPGKKHVFRYQKRYQKNTVQKIFPDWPGSLPERGAVTDDLLDQGWFVFLLTV